MLLQTDSVVETVEVAPEASGVDTIKEERQTPSNDSASRPQSSVKDELIEELSLSLAETPDDDVRAEDPDVSPVSSARPSRPETREDRQLSLEEQVTRITGGDMDVKYTPRPKVVKIFVHTGMTGMLLILCALYCSLRVNHCIKRLQ